MLTDLILMDVILMDAALVDLVLIGLDFARVARVGLRFIDCFTCGLDYGNGDLDRAADEPHRENKVTRRIPNPERKRV